MTARGEPFFYFIVEEIERRGLPAELALLPIVESAYQPFAYSRKHAAGIWQFIPATARLYGLKQTWWYDGRRDIYASTYAALDYLTRLNEQFAGDWLLTLAAYNAGPNRVRRALARNRKRGKPVDFWHLALPRQTREYVPQVIALRAIVDNPDSYNVALWPIANRPVITHVDIETQVELALAAELAGIDTDMIYRLNPGFSRWATDPAGPYRLSLPVDSATQFTQKLEKLPPEQRVNWVRHRIKSGETLSVIAKRYATTVALLKHKNRLRNSLIRAGKHLLVPKASKVATHYKERRKALTVIPNNGVKQHHTVAKGESLWGIARRYQVSSKALTGWNGLGVNDILKPGDRLVIWKPHNDHLQTAARRLTVTPAQDGLTTIRYSVKRGDSLYRIAKQFRVRVADLRRWNNLYGTDLLHPGQAVTLHVDAPPQSSEG